MIDVAADIDSSDMPAVIDHVKRLQPGPGRAKALWRCALAAVLGTEQGRLQSLLRCLFCKRVLRGKNPTDVFKRHRESCKVCMHATPTVVSETEAADRLLYQLRQSCDLRHIDTIVHTIR